MISLPLLVSLPLCIFYALKIAASDIHFANANTELSFWARQDYRPQQSRVSMAEKNINAALAGWPGNPDYLDAKARFLLWQSYWEERRALASTLSRQALELKLKALERRPARRQSWIDLARDKARLGQNDARFQLALEKIKTLKNGQH